VFEIGNSLRGARKRQKLELSDVERATRIRTKYLEALEEERFDVLPGTAYVKGFLRTYADFLGLDGLRFVDEYNEHFAAEEMPEAALPVRVRRPRHFLDARLVAIPLAVGIALFAWRLTSGGGHEHARPAPPPPRRAATTTAAVRAAAKTARPKVARIAFVAARGECWLSVRLGSESGRSIYERMLEPGQTARFVGTRFWIRVGAPWNVDATLNGDPAELPAATGNLVVTARGLRRLRG
jgi:cytoskeleton protein RodZ